MGLKKRFCLFGTAFFYIFIMLISARAFAYEIYGGQFLFEPYLKIGTIAADTLKGEGGHKSMFAGGIKAKYELDALFGAVTCERWWLGEKLDDDKGVIPNEGYNFWAELGYRFRVSGDLVVYPIAKVGYERWKSDEPINNWTFVEMYTSSFGAGLQKGVGFVEMAAILPFYTDTDSYPHPKGRPGFQAVGGICINSFTVGLFYKYMGVQDPDIKLIQSGIFLAYTFQ